MPKKAHRAKQLMVVLLIDPQETGEVAAWQDEAQRILDKSKVLYGVRHVRNDPRDGTFTPMLITELGGYTGLDRIALYAEDSHPTRKTKVLVTA